MILQQIAQLKSLLDGDVWAKEHFDSEREKLV